MIWNDYVREVQSDAEQTIWDNGASYWVSFDQCFADLWRDVTGLGVRSYTCNSVEARDNLNGLTYADVKIAAECLDMRAGELFETFEDAEYGDVQMRCAALWHVRPDLEYYYENMREEEE